MMLCVHVHQAMLVNQSYNVNKKLLSVSNFFVGFIKRIFFITCVNFCISYSEPRPECVVNQDCSNNKACINQACKDPCTESSNICATNADCRVQQHRPYCFCKDGLTGNPQSYCYESKCPLSKFLCQTSYLCIMVVYI